MVKKKLFKTKATNLHTIIHSAKRGQHKARNSQLRGAVFGGLGAEPPAAGGYWGSGGKAPSRWRHGGLGAEPQRLKILRFFFKNNLILGLYW